MKRALVLIFAVLLTACSVVATPTEPVPTATPLPTAPPATATAATTGGAATASPATTPPASPAGQPGQPGGATPAPPPPGAAQAPTRPAGTPAPPHWSARNYPNTSPEAAVALVGQAVDLLLDRYVNPLNSADLYAVAYDGMVAELQRSGMPAAGSRPSFTGEPQADAEAFRAAYTALAAGAGADVNNTALAYAAISAIVADIDECHTYFLDPERFEQFNARSEGSQSYAGIGATIRGASQPAIIGEVYPGTPAERAGLRSGDGLLAVDGQDVTTSPTDLIASLVRGPEGTQVTLTIQRPGEPASRNLTITRARITVPVFTARVIDGADGRKVGYMKLYSFSQGAEAQLDRALRDFQQQGVSSWVLDLRDNPGGLVTVFAELASRFINQQPAGYRVSADGRERQVPIDTRRYFGTQLPFAVLVNEGSASGSEAFSAAMQDYERARVFGETTAGCLAVGQTHDLADGSGMSVTIEKFLSPERREINQVGVEPDEVVADDPSRVNDPVLAAALAWLATQTR